eukprot:3607597-Pleurochrysis_carterae.AAC.5
MGRRGIAAARTADDIEKAGAREWAQSLAQELVFMKVNESRPVPFPGAPISSLALFTVLVFSDCAGDERRLSRQSHGSVEAQRSMPCHVDSASRTTVRVLSHARARASALTHRDTVLRHARGRRERERERDGTREEGEERRPGRMAMLDGEADNSVRDERTT